MSPGARPLIGVTTSEVRTARTLRKIPHGEPTPHEFALGVWYPRAIERAGGMPVIIPPGGEQQVKEMVQRLDGLCLPGGPDLDPATYGEAPHPKLGPIDPDIDRFELHMIRCADECEIPVFAICRGAQAINVAAGGTLIQHLPDVGGAINHRQTAPGNTTSHEVRIESDSRLAEIAGPSDLDVNTFHHQGIERLGDGLRAVGWAPDGTIEALESDNGALWLGVQWHAETLIDHERHMALFDALIAAARA